LGDWNLFFATAAGCAATLLGLLFVATQLHVEVVADETNRWAALAQSTLSILSIVFGLSLVSLIPGFSLQVRGEVDWLVVVIALWRVFKTWWPVFRLNKEGRRHRVAQSFWLLIAPILAYLYLLFGAAQLWLGDATALISIAAAFMTLFAIALRNAWRLVVSVERQAS
jgi:cytochrome bd-type quinol oxidase subunit 2